MLVTVAEMYAAHATGIEQSAEWVTVGDATVPMCLLDLVLRHIERDVSLVAEGAGMDVDSLRINTKDLPMCILVAMGGQSTMTKNAGDAVYGDLKRAYADAVEAKTDTLVVGGVELVTGYAKYLIELLDNRGVQDDVLLSSFLILSTDE
jgi:S-adenosylhomocysteine hydrolase